MKEKMIIFLDIDGVLNTRNDWKRPYSLNPDCVAGFKLYMAEKMNKYRCTVVLTSSWKAGFDYVGLHSKQIQALIDTLAKDNIKITGKTEDAPDGDRAAEVNTFIRQHKLENIKCIVIDDDLSIFKTKLLDNVSFHKTECDTGMKLYRRQKKRMIESICNVNLDGKNYLTPIISLIDDVFGVAKTEKT